VLLLLGAIAALLALWNTKTKPQEAALMYASAVPPEGVSLVSTSVFAGPVTISPDGTMIVFSAREKEGAQMLWLRRLDSPTAKPMPGTEGAARPFWSPDSRNIGFFSDTKLKRVGAEGGPVLTLTDVVDGRGGTWNRDGVIIFSADSFGPLFRVNASGGDSTQETKLNEKAGEFTHRFPQFLPDGKHFLYLMRTSTGGPGVGPGIFVSELGKPGAIRVLDAASNAICASGYLLFVRQRTLMAQKFDPEKLATEGEAIPLEEDVRIDARFTQGVFSASETGTLAYQTGEGRLDQVLQIVGRDGVVRSTIGEPGEYFLGGDPHFSPDGAKATAVIVDLQTGNGDVWLCDLKTGTRRRLTTGGGDKFTAVISPDGSRVAYPIRPADRLGQWKVEVLPINGNATPITTLLDQQATYVDGWTPDGKSLVLTVQTVEHHKQVRTVPADGGTATTLVKVNGDATDAQVSPDGKFLAYVSNESGRQEVYVESFPNGPGRWQVSQSGGMEPRWKADGKELFFFAPDNHLMEAQVSLAGNEFQVGEIKSLFQLNKRGFLAWRYDVSKDGQTFLVTNDVPDKKVPQITLVTAWEKLLKK
jgi:eukaryotic-like serine/threonine-protein kinase